LGDAAFFVAEACSCGSACFSGAVAAKVEAEGNPAASPARLAHFKNDRRFMESPCVIFSSSSAQHRG